MLISRIELENLLSFKSLDLELRPLNVLVGPNASGKSNLIRSLDLVRALPKRELVQRMAEGGGPRFWINRRSTGVARIHLEGTPDLPFDYSLSFQESGQSWAIIREEYKGVFERELNQFKLESPDKFATPSGVNHETPAGTVFKLGSPDKFAVPADASVISQVRHPSEPALMKFATALESIRLYREFRTGPGAQARTGTAANLLADHLDEDGGNLALRLNELNFDDGLKRINAVLKRFFELCSEVVVRTKGGITQLYLRETEVKDAFAATSLSDGTLRLLCLLAVLLDANPPPLMCIEEPEAGLHPDAIREIAGLLADASTRTQLIITTHSPTLIDALSDQPEAVMVCERDFDRFTQFRRLDRSKLDEWLERYTLGELWQKGEIGGNRW